MNETITIDGVDPRMLEKQRKTLSQVIHALHLGEYVGAENMDDLEGIENMLNSWSDARAQPHRHLYLFLRYSGDGNVDTVALYEILADSDIRDEVFDNFQSAITMWATTTEEGREVWESSDGDLNIGDMDGEFEEPVLQAILLGKGISGVRLLHLLTENAALIGYDTKLVVEEPTWDEV